MLPFPRSYYIRSFRDWKRINYPDAECECIENAFGDVIYCEECETQFAEYCQIRDQQAAIRDQMFGLQ
jgi:hypothetical protein